MFYWLGDWSYLILIPGLVLALLAQSLVRSAYAKYSAIPAMCGLSGADVARRVLSQSNIDGITVVRASGVLTDHYDPRSHTIKLSESVYGGTSIASISIAAHEASHAVQHVTGFLPFRLRSFLVPIVNIGTTLAFPVFFIGLLFTDYVPFLCDIGLILFGLAVLFQLITLPVELNASGRAMHAIQAEGVLSLHEASGARRMLSAAALTYVAAVLVSLLQLIRLLTIAGRRR